MAFKVETTPNFNKEAKRLIKKYPSLKYELAELGSELENNPFQGDLLGNHVYKIRMGVESKGKGKSGGARIISHVKVVKQIIYLFSIYSKGEKDSITNAEIKELLLEIPN